MRVYFITQQELSLACHGQTDRQNCYINIAHANHSVYVVGDEHLTANCQSYKVQVELLSGLLQCSTYFLTRWTAWPATGRSALQDLWSSEILQVSLALSPVSSSISCCIHARQGRPHRRLHSCLLSGLPAAIYTVNHKNVPLSFCL